MNVDQQLAHAKTLSKSGQYQQAKQILLKLHDTNSTNLDILRGLGRLCQYLNQYDEALGYYQTYNTITDQNPEIYRRIGDIYDVSNDLKQAEAMYIQALDISPYDIDSMISLALLMQSTSRFNKARKLYQDAITHNPSDARAHYFYGKLLKKNSNNINGAQYQFAKAMKLAPNINKYKNEWHQCIQLLENQQESKMNEFVFDKSKSNIIKLILYNFDNLILFHQCPIDELPNTYEAFGDNSRINRLYQHFQSITHNQNIKLSLLTQHHPKAVVNLLKEIQLFMFFESEPIVCNRFEEIGSKYCELNRDNILYIDLNYNLNGLEKFSQIYTLKPFSDIELTGLTLYHLEEIESIFCNNINNASKLYHTHTSYPFNIPHSMIKQNENVYNAIKTEIDTLKNGIHSVENLSVFKYIISDPDNCFLEYKQCFQDFAWKYCDTYIAMKKNDWWIAANMLLQLMDMEKHDYELHQKYAKCLSYLNLTDAADKHYEIALDLNNNSYGTHLGYAFHLCFRAKQYEKALSQFEFCIDYHEKENTFIQHCTVLSAIAKCASFSNKNCMAEKYYLLTLKYDNQKNTHKTARFKSQYGQFLYLENKLDAAKQLFEEAINLDPNNKYSYHKLSNVLFKMGKTDEHVIPLKKCLELDPDYYPARRDYKRFYHEDYNGDINNERKENDFNNDRNYENYNHGNYKENERNNLNSNIKKKETATSHSASTTSTTLSTYHAADKFQQEFNKIWWKEFGKEDIEVKERFKRYFVALSMQGLNDITLILDTNIKELKKDMKSRIQNVTAQDLIRIIALFKQIKNDNFLFKQYFEGNNVNNIVRKEIFEKNGIFTIEAMRMIKNKTQLCDLVDDNNMELRSGVSNELIDNLWDIIRQTFSQ
eukprot:235060_1